MALGPDGLQSGASGHPGWGQTNVQAPSTQPNPAAANLETWKKLVAVTAEAIALHLLLENPAEINKYADDPGDPVGSGRGFLKERHRKKTNFAMWLAIPVDIAVAAVVEEETFNPFLGFINTDDAKGLKAAATNIHGGSNQEAAEKVVAAWKSLGTAEIVQIAEEIKKDTAGYLPRRHMAAYTDGGTSDVTSAQFNVASNLLKVWGAYNRESYTSGQAQPGLGGRVVMNASGLRNDFIALSYSEIHALDTPWSRTLGSLAPESDGGQLEVSEVWDYWKELLTGDRVGEYIDRPLLIPEANASRLAEVGGLDVVTWKEIKENDWFAPSQGVSRFDASRVSAEYKHDNVVFLDVRKESSKAALDKYLQQFVFSIARNFPGEIQYRIQKAAGALVENREQSDNETAAARAGSNPKTRVSGFVDDAVVVDTNEKRDLKPIDLQCFLMENIGMIADYKARQATPYKNLMQLKSSMNDSPGETISILNCKGKQKEVRRLLNLAPSTYASLVPYIKLYRLDYTNADDADPMVPIAQQEIPIPNYMDPEDVSRITSGVLGRTSGWGIQSFSWKLDGLQPETVDNNISATLKLYFQSVDDLFKGARGSDGRDQAGRATAGPLDLLIPSAACREKDPPEDPPPGVPRPAQSCVAKSGEAASQARNGPCFRIKVVAGWATPPNLEETHPDLKKKSGGNNSETEGEILRRGLRETRITLYLQQTRHNLSFNENGSVSLSIDYQAALSGILTDNRMDILGTNDTAIQAQLKDLKAKAKGATNAAATIAARINDPEELKDNAAYKAQKEKETEYVQKQIDLQNQDKLKKYKRFLSRLYGRHGGPEQAESPKMYVMEVDPLLLRQKKLADEPDPEVRAARARQLMTGTSALRGWAITNPLSHDASKSALNTDLLDLMEGANDLEEAQESTDETGKQFQNNLGSGRNIYIPYFYLGDLIDTILQNNETAHFRPGGHGIPGGFMTFLADMHVTNPLLMYQASAGRVGTSADGTSIVINDQADLMCANYDSIDSRLLLKQLKAKGYIFDGGVKKRINIGQIPISLDSFNVWFKNKVIKGGLPTYYLLHFLKDVCAQLITDSLKSTCFNTNIINDIRFDLSHVHFNNRHADGRPRYPNGPKHTIPVQYEGELEPGLAHLMGSSETLHRDIPPPGTSVEQRKRYNVTSGLVLYCTDMGPRNRRGRLGIDEDQDVGIYHNYVGSPVGLVKKLTFTRMQQQYLKEAKIQKLGNLGAEQLRELYSANLELIGNTLYKNGQYTFLWPSAMTTGDDSRIVNLGLGGYFLIKSVSHTISRSGYTVTMTALQEGMEIGEEAMVEPRTISGDLAPGDNPFFTEEGGRRLAYETERARAEAAAKLAAAQQLEYEKSDRKAVDDLTEAVSLDGLSDGRSVAVKIGDAIGAAMKLNRKINPGGGP